MSEAEPRFHGLHGDSHTVRLPDGQTQTVKAGGAPVSMPEGDPVDAARKVTRGRGARQGANFRGQLRRAADQVVSARGDVDHRLRPGQRPSPAATQGIKDVAASAFRDAEQRALKKIRDNAQAGAARELRAQSEALRKMGLPPLDRATLNSIVNNVAKQAVEGTFPGTNKNSRQRAAALARRAQAAAEPLARATKGEQATRANRKMRRQLHESTQGVRVRGGSVGRQLERINRTEVQRAVQDATRQMAKEIGIKFAYWRLSSGHRHQGGKEICEVLSQSHGPDVIALIEKFKVTAPILDGLYSIDKYPHVPHPNCACAQEVWHPPELLAELKVDDYVEDGVIPDSVMSVSRVPAQLAGSFNRLASELGIPPTVTLRAAQVFGPEGVAALLARQIPPSKLTDLSNTMNVFREKLVPQVQQQLAQARETARAMRARVQADDLLSPITRASQVAEIQVQLRREVDAAMSLITATSALSNAMRNPNQPITTSKFASPLAIVRSMRLDFGLDLTSQQLRITKSKGSFRGTIDPVAVSPNVIIKMISRQAAIADIKSGKLGREVRGLQERIHMVTKDKPRGVNIHLDSGQKSGVRFIEEQKRVLLHFAAGLGKTPTVIGSVSDLHHQGKVKAALISTPASLRTQMVQEIMQFNKKGRVALYVGKASVASTRKAIEAGISVAVLEGVPHKIVNGKMVPDRSKMDASYADELVAEIARRNKRFVVKEASRDPAVRAASLAADRKAGVLFTVMGHDDLARAAVQARKSFDYIAIDEIHQMTSQSVAGGSYKANQLQKLTGGSIKYNVALTGTASKNNMGEFWDIANWVRPGELGSKRDFMAQYEGLSLRSDILHESLVRALRQRIDSFTFTKASPVAARIHNAFAETHPDGTVRSQRERDGFIRQPTMTPRQRAAAERIERTFTINKRAQRKMPAKERARALSEHATRAANLERTLSSLGLSEYADHDRLRNRLRKAGVSSARTEELMDLRTSVRKNAKVLFPESWRDNSHARNINGGDWKTNAKVQETIKLVTAGGEMEGQRPIIHVDRIESLEAIKAALQAQGLKVGQLDGSMSAARKDAAKAQMNGGALDVFIVTRAGSTGLNLQRASTSTVHFDLPWTYAEYGQREARNWRKGQKHDVTSVVLAHSDAAIDQKKLQLVRDKKQQLDAVDELTKSNDRSALMTSAGESPKARSWDSLVAERGKKSAEALLATLVVESEALRQAVKSGTMAKTPVEAAKRIVEEPR